MNKQEQASRVVQSIKESAATKQQQVMHALQTEIKNGKDVIAKMTAEMERGSFAAVREMEWAESRMETITVSALAEKVVAIAEQRGLIKALTAVKEEELRNLMINSYRSNSTSQYHNAVQGSKREAACRFIGKLTHWIEWLA